MSQKEVLAQDINTLATGAGISLAGALAGRGIHACGQIVLARLLGPASFGLYAIGWTLLRIIGTIAPLGLDRGVIRFASHYWHENSAALRGVLFQSLGIAIGASTALGAAFYLAAPWLALRVLGHPGLVPVLRLFALAFPLYTGLRVATAATRITRRMQFSILAEGLTPPIVSLLLFLLLYLIGWRLLGAVAATVVAFGLAFLLAMYYVWRLFPEVTNSGGSSVWLGRELLKFSVPASLVGVFTMMNLWVDRLLVAYFRPAADVGLYQAASQSAILFAMVLAGFNAVLAPMISDLHHRGEYSRLQELYRVSTKWTLYLSLPLFLVIVCAPQSVMTVVFGPVYGVAWPALIILAAAQMVNGGTGAVGLLLIMTGRQTSAFTISATMLLVNIVLNILLIPRWGIIGAATATAVAVSGLFFGLLARVRWSLHLWPYDRRYFKGLLAGCVSAALILGVRVGMGRPTTNLLGLFLLGLISAAMFTGLLLLAGLDREDRDFLHSLRALIKR